MRKQDQRLFFSSPYLGYQTGLIGNHGNSLKVEQIIAASQLKAINIHLCLVEDN